MSDPLTQTMLKANSSVPWLVPGFQQGNIPGGTGNLWGLPGKPNVSPPLVLGPNTTMARPAEQEAFPFDPKPKLGTSRPLTDADKLGLLMELANSRPQNGQLPMGIQPISNDNRTPTAPLKNKNYLTPAEKDELTLIDRAMKQWNFEGNNKAFMWPVPPANSNFK
jgi:hypothetical protein